MQLTGMRFEGEPIPDYNYVSGGDLWLDGEKVKYFVPVPLDFQGKVEIAMLVGEDFLTRKIYADSVSTSLEGEFRLETLWDADGNPTAA
jgi:hypothetical protein